VRSVAIVGVGLIGGSFAKALRAAGFAGPILGVSSPATLAKAGPIVDRPANLDEAACCDLVFLSRPISGILETLEELRTDSIVTDAGSTKRVVCAAAAHLPNFTGGHPMAGKEVSGVEHSDPNLFRDRPWLFTSEPPSPLREWVTRIGARIVVTTPEEHDRLVALASHLPQLLSNALAEIASPARHVSGPGLESMTRLSASPFEIWKDILDTNGDEILRALDLYRDRLGESRAALAEGRPRDLFLGGADRDIPRRL